MRTFAHVLIAVVGCGLSGGGSYAQGTDSPTLTNLPERLGTHYVGSAQWQQLDTLVEKLAASSERAEDGRLQLHLVTSGIEAWIGLNQDGDTNLQQRLADYRKHRPASAFAPVLAAMQVHAATRRAAGDGPAASERAWQMMQACKSSSARLPVWYEQAIQIAANAKVPEQQLEALFKEGVARFPGYYPIYSSYERRFAPLWGGDYVAADEFIRRQTAAKYNREGEVLYTRLYWQLDELQNGDRDFFTNSRVDWQRMRSGFELLMQRYPDSVKNQATYSVFACRANDAATYWKLRDTLDTNAFKEAAPKGISLDDCDDRFTSRS